MSFALAQYKSTHVETASPVRIVVQLYDGAIRFMKTGAQCIDEGDVAGKALALKKAHAIVTELQATLDRSHASELCEELDRLYEFVVYRVTEANIKSDSSLLPPAVAVMTQLRDAWEELARRQG